MNNSIKILTFNLNRMFPKETYKFLKKCSILLVVKEMQIKLLWDSIVLF